MSSSTPTTDALPAGGAAGAPRQNAPGGTAPAALSYADVFGNAQPAATLPLLQTRFSNANRLHKDLVDYLAARRELEEQYLKNLAKLVSKRALFDAADSPSALAAGGVYATPSVQPLLDALLRELQATAAIHSELEDRISKQIEGPLRALPSTHSDWSHLRELEDGLAAQIKELGSLEAQLDKDRKKLASTPSSNIKKHSQATNKFHDSQQAYDRALALWATEAPFTFEAYGRIDKSRLDALVEAVIQFETAQAESAQKLMRLSEQTTTVALGLESGAEIRAFLQRAQNSMPKADTAPPASFDDDANGNGILASSSLATAANMSSTSLPSIANASGAIGDTSVSTTQSRRPSPPPTSSSSGSTLRGALSRLGGRKGRESQFGLPSSSRDGANTNTIYGSLPEDEADSARGDAYGRTSSQNRTPSLFRASRTSVDRERPRTGSTAPPAMPSNSLPGEFGESSNGDPPGSLMAPMVPQRAAPKSSAASNNASISSPLTAPPVDAEGFSIPPPDRKPWQTGSSAQLHDGTEDLLDSTAPSLPSRVNNLTITGSAKTTGMADSDRDREALERMRSTLGAPLSASGDGVTRRSTTSRRERRSTRAFNGPQGLPEEGLPPTSFTAPMPGLGGQAEGRTGSMLSTTSGFGMAGSLGASTTSLSPTVRAHSQGASVGALAANPFESSLPSAATSKTGVVRASITETVNAVFSGANLARVQVVGEVQILLSGSGSGGKLNLSLSGPSAISRAAPNPAYLIPNTTGDHDYLLDTAALLSQGGEARATVLKYQLDLPAQSTEVVPIDVHAQWRCEPTQTSLMISYRRNTASSLFAPRPGQDDDGPASLDDFEVVVPISPPGSVQTVMSKPNGDWDGDASKLQWTLSTSSSQAMPGAFHLPPAGETGKLLARMQVDKQSTPQPVNVRWSIRGRTVSTLQLRISPATGSEGDASSAWVFEPADTIRLTASGKFMAT